MTPEEMRAALNAVLADKATFGWWQLFIVVLAAGLAAYCGAYFKKRGENRANEESFEAIRAQLRQTTRDTEEIKTTIAQTTWLSQTQWIAREKFYSAMMAHLRQLETSLSDRCDYFQSPGSEYDEVSIKSADFQALEARGYESVKALRELLGPASLHLGESSLGKIEALLADLWNVGEESICTADYVRRAFGVVADARAAIQAEARSELFGNPRK